MNELVGGVWDKAEGLLERRFITTCLVPVLVFFPVVSCTVAFGIGALDSLVHQISALDASALFVVIVGYFLSSWFIAAFLQSQLRNLIQFYEGYRVPLFDFIWERGRVSHRERHEVVRVTDSVRQYYEYPLHPNDILPTRLGNVLRASERYADDRYSADTIVIWPRLVPLLPPEFASRVEGFRESLEFLLVACTWCWAFALMCGTGMLIGGGSPVAFALTVAIGFGASRFAYTGAVEAAKEYGEQLRVGMDLYRTLVLEEMGLYVPKDLEGERRQWQALYGFVYTNDEEGLRWYPASRRRAAPKA